MSNVTNAAKATPPKGVKVITGRKQKNTWFDYLNWIIMAVVVIVMLYPFWYLVVQSLSSQDAVIAGRVSLWPVEFTLDTYRIVMSDSRFFLYYWNTIKYVVVGTIIAVFFTAMLAYPLSKRNLRLNKFFTPFVAFTMYFGGGMIPNYILVNNYLHMGNTMWSIVIPGAIGAYYVLLMRSFFQSIPQELEEAASIDGMNTYGIFFKIILPLSKPILATMILFNAVNIWNNWFSTFLYITDSSKWPISYYLRTVIYGATSVTDIASSMDEASKITATVKSCCMVVTALPIICVYPFVQKYFVQGMMLGSVKG